MTIIGAGEGWLTPAGAGAAERTLAGDEAVDELAGAGQDMSFMALLQQATAVLPQVLAAIRDELPDDVLVGDQQLLPTDATPASLLAQLAVAQSLQGGARAQAGQEGAQNALDTAPVAVSAGALSGVGIAVDEAALPNELSMHVDAFSLATPSSTAPVDGTPTAAAGHRTLHTPVGAQGWADELGARLTVLGARGEHTASLRLSPEHLGPLEIRIAIKDDQASVWFGAAQAQTREAIEQALPRLREMLHEQGLTLSDAGVFDESPARQPSFARRGEGMPDVAPQEVPQREVAVRGLLDLYV